MSRDRHGFPRKSVFPIRTCRVLQKMIDEGTKPISPCLAIERGGALNPLLLHQIAQRHLRLLNRGHDARDIRLS